MYGKWTHYRISSSLGNQHIHGLTQLIDGQTTMIEQTGPGRRCTRPCEISPVNREKISLVFYLVLPQRNQRIDLGGASSRYQHSEDADDDEQEGDANKRHGIVSGYGK